MRFSLLIGTLLITTGAFIFTRDDSLRWFFMIPGAAVGLLGLVAVASGITVFLKQAPHQKTTFRRVGVRRRRARVAAASA